MTAPLSSDRKRKMRRALCRRLGTAQTDSGMAECWVAIEVVCGMKDRGIECLPGAVSHNASASRYSGRVAGYGGIICSGHKPVVILIHTPFRYLASHLI